MSPVKPEPFWDKVDRTGGPDACWPWLRHLSTGGYGRQDKIAAHRMAYELLVGPIPEGLELDHLCHVRRCLYAACRRWRANVRARDQKEHVQ